MCVSPYEEGVGEKGEEAGGLDEDSGQLQPAQFRTLTTKHCLNVCWWVVGETEE